MMKEMIWHQVWTTDIILTMRDYFTKMLEQVKMQMLTIITLVFKVEVIHYIQDQEDLLNVGIMLDIFLRLKPTQKG